MNDGLVVEAIERQYAPDDFRLLVVPGLLNNGMDPLRF
jgi:hypothetical protein